MDSKEWRVFSRRKGQRGQSPTQYTWGRISGKLSPRQIAGCLVPACEHSGELWAWL